MKFIATFKTYLIIAAVLTVFQSAPVFAQTMKFAFDGVDTIAGDEGTEATKGTHVSVNWNGELQLGQLGGEPVVSLRFKFAPTTGRVTLPILGARIGEPNFEWHSFQNMPEDLREKLKLIDVKLRMSFFSAAGVVDLVADVGATGAPGEWYFNVPGSPDWAKLFLREHASDVWISKDVAKSIWESGLTLSSARIEAASLTLYDMHETYMKENDRERYRVMGRAYERLAEGLERSYGLKMPQENSAWSQVFLDASRNGDIGSPDEWSARSRALNEQLGKLGRLPQQMRRGDNHAPYDQAVKDVAQILGSINYEVSRYVPVGVDPDTIEKGYAPEFGEDSNGGPKFVIADCGIVSCGKFIYSVNADGSLKRIFETRRHKLDLVNDKIISTDRLKCSDRDQLVREPDGSPIDLSMVECPSDDYALRVSQADKRFYRDEETKEFSESVRTRTYYEFGTAERFEVDLVNEEVNDWRKWRVATYYFDKDFRFLRVEKN
jgi:hypothetical protein